ncbi:MAG: adenylate kinase [Thermoanaerobaculia bacterium]|nr:adenylate kinase [Thermoanaerobaculia bacterium]
MSAASPEVWRIVFLGPPNSGKGTQAVRLAAELRVPAISTGEMLRAAVAAGSPLGLRVEGVLASGDLVGDDLMADVVVDRLGQADARQGFILDGYPRTPAQAETLAQIISGQDVALDAVLLVEAPEETLVQRALGRGREDDREEIIRERLRVYREKTAPLIDFYAAAGILHQIDGNLSIEEVGRLIRTALGAGRG